MVPHQSSSPVSGEKEEEERGAQKVRERGGQGRFGHIRSTAKLPADRCPDLIFTGGGGGRMLVVEVTFLVRFQSFSRVPRRRRRGHSEFFLLVDERTQFGFPPGSCLRVGEFIGRRRLSTLLSIVRSVKSSICPRYNCCGGDDLS